MERLAKSPDLNPNEHLWDQLGRAVRVRVTNTTTLADLQPILVEEWNAIPQQRDQVGDQHEEEEPGWIFHRC